MARRTKALGAALVAFLCSVALFAAPAAHANHSFIVGQAIVFKKGEVAGSGHSELVPCTTTACPVAAEVPLNRRDYNRAVRTAGGATSFPLVVPDNGLSGAEECFTKSIWAVCVRGDMQASVGGPTAHPGATVTFTVNLVHQ